jgi:hypothetical protein
LSAQLLGLIGFTEFRIGVEEFKDCKVNIFGYPNLDRFFFRAMYDLSAWKDLNYELIITDNVKSHFEKESEPLDIQVFPHAAIRGSNNWKGSKILTVLSHIPVEAIQKLVDAFGYFGCGVAFNDVEALFYRDRLCQAIGRVLGYRGAKETDVIAHKLILDKIESLGVFPYQINKSWVLEFEKFEQVKELQNHKKTDARYKSHVNRICKAEDLSFLNEILEVNEETFIPISEFKSKTKLKITSTKVVNFFSNPLVYTKVKRVNGKPTQVIQGVKFK